MLAAGALTVVLCWEHLKTIWDDSLYQAVASMTMYLIPLATVPLILRRRSAMAESPIIYGSFAGMIILWWGVMAGFYGEAFRTWQYLAAGVVAFTGLSALTYWVWRLRSGTVPPPYLIGALSQQDFVNLS